MPEQEITIKLTVPDGHEVAGEPRQDGRYDFGDSYGIYIKVPLRKVWQAPAWIPDGYWVWKGANSHAWRVSHERPLECGDGYLWPDNWSVSSLAALYRDTFSPPPVDCIQVNRAPQE